MTEVADFDLVLTHPADWYLAEESLTPNLGDPREVFSLGTFPLRPGGPNCAQVPSQALHDLGADDVFVTVQERSGADPLGFDPRPDNFGRTPGSTETEFYECLEPEERADIGAMHWIWFTDQERYFHVLVVIGRDAAPKSVSTIWSTLDQMVIEVPSQTLDTDVGLVVPDGFLPGVLATDFEGEFIAIDITTGESLHFVSEDVGISGALSGTLLSNGVVVLAGVDGSRVSVFGDGLSEVPTTLRAGFHGFPMVIPTPDPTHIWLVEIRPPWRIELHSVGDQSTIMETSTDLAEEAAMQPAGATADGLVLQAVVYEDRGNGYRIPVPESESVYLVDPGGDIHDLGNGVVLTFGQHAIFLRECVDPGCRLTEVRTDTGDRREVSNRVWSTPTGSGDTGEAFDQWSVVSPSGTEVLFSDDSGVFVLDLRTMHIESLPFSAHAIAAWADDVEIIAISERLVQVLSADAVLRDVATVPEGFYVLDAGY